MKYAYKKFNVRRSVIKSRKADDIEYLSMNKDYVENIDIRSIECIKQKSK